MKEKKDNGKPKDCLCITCNKDFHSLGIMSHRAMHRRKKEDCEIYFSNQLMTKKYFYSRLKHGALIKGK